MPGKPHAQAPGPLKLAAITRLNPPEPAPAAAAWREGSGAAGVTRRFADYRGRGILLNAWATWCGPCVAELPSLARLAPMLDRQGAVVLPVSMDRTPPDAIGAFLAAHGAAGLPVLTDDDTATRTAFGIGAIPVTFLIGRDGMVRGRLDGPADWTEPDALATLAPFLA